MNKPKNTQAENSSSSFSFVSSESLVIMSSSTPTVSIYYEVESKMLDFKSKYNDEQQQNTLTREGPHKNNDDSVFANEFLKSLAEIIETERYENRKVIEAFNSKVDNIEKNLNRNVSHEMFVERALETGKNPF